MISKRFTLALALTLHIACTAAKAETFKAASAAPAPIKTFDDLVAFAGAGEFDSDISDFDVLFFLIKLVKLPTFDAAVNGTPFTLFAPTDAAWIQAATDLGLVEDGADEATASAALATAQVASSGESKEPAIITTLLNYHIATEKLDAAAVLSKTSIDTFATDADFPLPIRRGLEGVDILELIDLAPALPNAKIVATDVQAFNGVIHIIDRVLVPFGLRGATAALKKPFKSLDNPKIGVGEFDDDTSNFDVLYYLIELVKLPAFDAAVNGAAFTLFAPNDAAFIATAKDLGLVDDGADEAAAVTAIAAALGKMGDLPELITTILNYHIVPIVVSSSALMNTEEMKTLAEGLTIARGREGMFRLELADKSPVLTNAKIYLTDSIAFNGVVHAIDRVLLPISLGPHA